MNSAERTAGDEHGDGRSARGDRAGRDPTRADIERGSDWLGAWSYSLGPTAGRDDEEVTRAVTEGRRRS
jgi:hypothetical protein